MSPSGSLARRSTTAANAAATPNRTTAPTPPQTATRSPWTCCAAVLRDPRPPRPPVSAEEMGGGGQIDTPRQCLYGCIIKASKVSTCGDGGGTSASRFTSFTSFTRTKVQNALQEVVTGDGGDNSPEVRCAAPFALLRTDLLSFVSGSAPRFTSFTSTKVFLKKNVRSKRQLPEMAGKMRRRCASVTLCTLSFVLGSAKIICTPSSKSVCT